MRALRGLAGRIGLTLVRYANMIQPAGCNMGGAWCIIESEQERGAFPQMNSEKLRKIRSGASELRASVVEHSRAQPTPVVKLAEKLGYQVVEFEPSAKTKDISGAVDRESKTIFVNKNETPTRKRFTVAHEIGHIKLHEGEGNHLDYRHQIGYDGDQMPKEREANQFAAELLMPRQIFESLWLGYEGDVELIAETLMVSKQAASIRAQDLGLS